mgnify:CR=1 FL=1
MMTNGWRRFSWQKILNNQFPSIRLPAENAGIVIKGQAASMINGNVTLLIKASADSMTYFATAPVDRLGNFILTGLNFHDTAQVYFQ